MNEQIDPQALSAQLAGLRNSLNDIVLGQQEVIEQVLTALLAGGHVLLEGVPGLGKTLLVRALAASFQGEFRRIQFTPDLMPADITGHAIYNMGDGSFRIRRGPVFTHLLLADEVNRASAKTQSALLEVMQEKQVTIEGETHTLQSPFMVLATQNPIEQEGTYPLPEAQLDRFLMKIVMDYPDIEQEAEITRQVTDGDTEAKMSAEGAAGLLTTGQVDALRAQVRDITVDAEIVNYAVRLTRATRNHPGIRVGASPRASIGLVQAARASAMLRGASFVVPDDIKRMTLPLLRHRVMLTADAEIDGHTQDTILEAIVKETDAPRQ